MMRNIPPIPQGLPPQNAPSNSLVAVPIPSNNNVLLCVQDSKPTNIDRIF